jgi:cation diffusion facilitator family transporter
MNVRKVLLIEGSVNVLVCLSKLGVGLTTGSSVIIADALHSLADVANNFIAWMAIKIAQSPADNDHPYGHQKYEQLAVFGLASLLVIVAFEVLHSAFERFGQVVEQSILGLVILVCALAINIALALWERNWAKRLDSDILHADASHTFSDVLSSIVVIVGWQLASQGYYWIDTLFTILLSSIVFYLAYKLFQRAIPILVDHSNINPDDVSQAVANMADVQVVGRVRARSLGKKNSADIIVMVKPNLSITSAHRIADDIEQLLADKFDIQDVVVHVEPQK